jgi:hypothetical protein
MMLNWPQATLSPKEVTALGGVKVISLYCGCMPVRAPSHLLFFMSCRSWLRVTRQAPRSRAYGLPGGNSWEISRNPEDFSLWQTETAVSLEVPATLVARDHSAVPPTHAAVGPVRPRLQETTR